MLSFKSKAGQWFTVSMLYLSRIQSYGKNTALIRLKYGKHMALTMRSVSCTDSIQMASLRCF
ncbi:MAG: hypothetical protein Q8908_02405, partial [Bacteroidota bacterium]|nr:hypothetical protein [Bacteroidota bacterium]